MILITAPSLCFLKANCLCLTLVIWLSVINMYRNRNSFWILALRKQICSLWKNNILGEISYGLYTDSQKKRILIIIYFLKVQRKIDPGIILLLSLSGQCLTWNDYRNWLECCIILSKQSWWMITINNYKQTITVAI